MIELRHVKKVYPEVTPLKDVNTVIHDGDVISVIGPSGTGKSTLLRCINMLEPPTGGDILVDGKLITDPKTDIAAVRKKMGMVFQSFNLFGHMTILENVMIPQIDLLGRSKQEAYDKAMPLLKKVGMSERCMQYPDQLSGGQKQRVAIARTLAMDPDIILFDEPTSALDPSMVGEVQSVIRDLSKSGITMMIVTHEMKFAREICNRVFYMDQGGIYEDGTPEQIFEHPEKDRTRRFIRRLKVLEIEADAKSPDLPGAVGRIETYCKENYVSEKLAWRCRLVFEELSCNILPDEKKGCRHMRFIYEYDKNNDQMGLQVLYDGNDLASLRDKDQLSVTILNNSITNMEYRKIEQESFTNERKMILKS